ncbi:alpha/beta hydrolase [Sphingosinicella soli]|uniref:Acetyl esterase n=1 Tax=Sphingosinicella soli TaxID=333708 RepID=A0A7W7B299_9SPHN|nr:alpha/beta hydrolase [Sphingosinicella soli]MBB4632664.1 acetyl esterase [Sphingosinicella soli]
MNPVSAGSPDDLDPDIRRFQREMAAAYGRYPDFDRLPLAERRRIAEDVRAPWAAGGPVMHDTRTLAVGADGVRVRIHRPDRRAVLPVLVYIHGGGWTMFSLDTHDRLMREYAARAGVAVIGVDYSLSPEAKFPAALGEIVSVIRWLRAEGPAHGLDSARIAIGGDSAGGNMAVATNLRLLADGDAPLTAMLVNYGALDSRPAHPGYRRYDGPAYNLTAAEMAVFWENYTRGPHDLDDPLACPMRADVAGLPPAFFAVAECDILADENRLMAARLTEAGIPAELHIYPGAAHSFLEAVSISPLAERALAESSAWLCDHLKAAL